MLTQLIVFACAASNASIAMRVSASSCLASKRSAMKSYDFIADLLEAKQLDADTRMAIDALEAAQANTMSWVNMLVDC